MDARLLGELCRQVAIQGHFALAAHTAIYEELDAHTADIVADVMASRAGLRRPVAPDEPNVLELGVKEWGHEIRRRGLRQSISAPWLISVWRNVESCLASTANVAKACWGTGGAGRLSKSEEARRSQRAPLRSLLGLGDDSPLNNVAVRNSFEHFDERLETWVLSGTGQVDLNIGLSIARAGDGPHVLRNFDPATGELIFWEKSINLGDVTAELGRIVPLAEEAWVDQVLREEALNRSAGRGQ